MSNTEPQGGLSRKRRFGTFVFFYLISNITLVIIMIASAFGIDRTGHGMDLFWLYFVIFVGGMALIPLIFYHITKQTEDQRSA